MKKVLAVFAAATAVAAATLPAYAKNCSFLVSNPPLICQNGTIAKGRAGSTITTFTQTTNTFDYTWNYEFGPTFPTASASLVNQDGVTFTKNVQTGNRCNPVVDGLKDGVAAHKTCEVFASDLPGGAVFLKVTIP